MKSSKPVFSFGVITDCQYADDPDLILEDSHRYFRDSPRKLKEAVEFFNQQNLKFVTHLGDLIDRQMAGYEVVLPICRELKAPLKFVVGNHDFKGEEIAIRNDRDQVKQVLGLDNFYYSFEIDNWCFIVLDTNEDGVIEWQKGTKEWEQGQQLLDWHEANGRINAFRWNGKPTETQIAWMLAEIKKAEIKKQNVIVLGHHPFYPEHHDNMLNDKEFLEILANQPPVKAYFCGHNHKGAYAKYKNLHCLTFPAMVEAVNNSYSLVHMFKDKIEIEGFGSAPNLQLNL